MKFNPERFVQNVVPDLRDNLKSKEAPYIASERIENAIDAAPLVDRLLLSETRQQLERDIMDFETGEYRARVAVGSAEEGTRHPHDYIINKSHTDTTFYFVDPEHQMGMSKNRSAIPLPRKGDLRPKISTLIGVKMSEDEIIPDISMIRYRASAITDPHLLKMQPQLEILKRLLETGEVPDVLVGKENEITFRLNVRKDDLLVQSRYASNEELKRFLHGEESAPALEGKVHSVNVIMRHFLKHLEQKRFQSLTPQALREAA